MDTPKSKLENYIMLNNKNLQMNRLTNKLDYKMFRYL
jgi:hypothetical protein